MPSKPVTKCRLKFKPDIPWDREYKLVNEAGFRIYARKRGDFVIFEKDVPKFTPQHTLELLTDGQLPEHIQLALRKRCNAVVALYLSPEENVEAIKARLENIATTLPPHQMRFIKMWIQNNLDSEDLFGAN